MKYVLMQNIYDETDTFYYITSDDYGEVIGCVDLNCNPIQPASEASVKDKNVPIPSCAAQQP